MSESPATGSPPLETTAPEPARSRGRLARSGGVALALVVVGLAALALLHPATRTRFEVARLARKLDSKDPMERTAARHALLDLGRPAIDSVYARLVAGEIADELTGQRDAVVLVGSERPRDPDPQWHSRAFDVERVVASVGQVGDAEKGVAFTDADLVCPIAKRLVRPGARRVLALVAWRSTTPDGFRSGPTISFAEERVEVPLDGDELAPEVIEAVVRRLSERFDR